MNKIVSRTLLTVIFVPSLVVLIVVLPHLHHLGLNLLIIACSFLGASEALNFFIKKGMPVQKTTVLLASVLIPAAAYAGLWPELRAVLRGIDPLAAVFVAFCLAVLFRETWRRKPEALQNSLASIASSITVVVYPGLFMASLVRISSFGESTVLLVTYFLMAMGNDVFAYIFGMFFGKNNRNVVPVSPNKSVAGFVGGFAVSILVGVLCYLVFPRVYAGHLAFNLIAGAVMGVTTILGDLVESAMKRSADLKDSGTVVPGRGGLLDSADSLILSAPIYIVLATFLLG